MIVSCVLRLFRTYVHATEAVEVTPVWNDGDYTYQADNQYLTLQSNQIFIQDQFIYQMRYSYDIASDYNKNQIKNTLLDILTNMVSRIGASSSRWVWFSRNLDSTYNSSSFYYHTISATKLSNVTYADATLNDGYKLLSVPFYSFSRNSANYISYVNFSNGERTTLTTGSQMIPCAELGCYSSNWFDLFEHVGLLNDLNEDVLGNIEYFESQNLYYNSYSYYELQDLNENITSNTFTTQTSSGITQPNVSQPDLSDAIDTLTELMTTDTAYTKTFNFKLPYTNSATYSIQLSPDFLRNSLTRVRWWYYYYYYSNSLDNRYIWDYDLFYT